MKLMCGITFEFSGALLRVRWNDLQDDDATIFLCSRLALHPMAIQKQ